VVSHRCRPVRRWSSDDCGQRWSVRRWIHGLQGISHRSRSRIRKTSSSSRIQRRRRRRGGWSVSAAQASSPSAAAASLCSCLRCSISSDVTEGRFRRGVKVRPRFRLPKVNPCCWRSEGQRRVIGLCRCRTRSRCCATIRLDEETRLSIRS